MTDLIIKLLRGGELSPEERKLFNEWLSHSGNEKLYRKAAGVWSAARMKVSSSEEPDEKSAWKRISPLVDGRGRKGRRILSAVAACVAAIIVTGLSWYVLYDLKTESRSSGILFGSVAGKTLVRLDDGSEVWLRDGAYVDCPNDFGRKTRTVCLSGEAFFNVSKDSSRPFRINVSGLGIEVLGTSFGVEEVPDGVVVNLVEGSVKLVPECRSADDFTDPPHGVKIMVSGETAYYKKENGAISVSRGDTEYSTLWAHDRLSFSNDDIVDVCSRLSVWYDVNISVSDKADTGAMLSFTVTDEPLDVILSLIRRACPGIGYRYNEDGSVQIY